MASFRNDDHELKLELRPVYPSSASQQVKHNQRPKSYRVQTRQDWLSEGLAEGHSLSAKVDSWEEAVSVATDFMQEFVTERSEQPLDTVEATHRSVEGHRQGEQLLSTEAAAEALADTAGYSDELLQEVVKDQTNDQYLAVCHRVNHEITPVAVGDDVDFDTLPLKKIYAAFSTDTLGIQGLFENVEEFVSTIVLGEYVVYRFVVTANRETNIILRSGTQVVSPSFEKTVWNVLEEKY